jgi:hypothetical protein
VARKQNCLLFFYYVAAILVIAGCALQQQKRPLACAGKKSAEESLSALQLQSQNTSPLKATGQCLLQYYVEGKKHKENFPVKLWVNPPAEIYLQGEVAFNPRGLVLGSNEQEFWLAAKPDEISSYWWGLWSEESYNEKLMIRPKIVLEALGIVAIGEQKGGNENWFFSKEHNFDILTETDSEGEAIKRVYINNCDYLVRKIEHCVDGAAMVAAELDKYKEVQNGFFVPANIKITKLAGVNRGDSVRITFDSIKPALFSDKLRSRLFTRPQPQGFEHIYRVVGGSIVEQR